MHASTYPGLVKALCDAGGTPWLPVLYAVDLLVGGVHRVLTAVGAKAGGATTSILLVRFIYGFHVQSGRRGGCRGRR
jgi:hypothetical protein